VDILEKFNNEIKNHQMKVLLDQGVYRHLSFSRPGTSSYSFAIITGPGFLLYRGDMGCYEFERLNDMFNFFRGGAINPGYWSEKVESISKFGSGIRKFNHDSFEQKVLQEAKDFAEESELCGTALEQFNEQIDDLISSVEYEDDAYRQIREWEFDEIETNDDEFFKFTAEDIFGCDSWEFDFKEYTHHYLWCCHAIVWGINQYDQLMSMAEINKEGGLILSLGGRDEKN